MRDKRKEDPGPRRSTLESCIIEIGQRVPHHFFITSGIGESDLTIHAGSYHLALRDAGIEEFNHMTYSSILPGIAEDIGRKPEGLIHGSVMEGICAVANVKRGKLGTAGIGYGWLSDRVTKERFGGLVCEYNGNLNQGRARRMLYENLQELYTNGYSEKYVLEEPNFISRSIRPKKEYGTALVAMCFTSYQVPIIKERPQRKR